MKVESSLAEKLLATCVQICLHRYCKKRRDSAEPIGAGAEAGIATGAMCLIPKTLMAGESRCGMDVGQRQEDMEWESLGLSVHPGR